MSTSIASTPQNHDAPNSRKPRFGLMLAAIGVVFGDIGTSPIYTLKEAFSSHYGLQLDQDTIFGIISLMLWALILVVTVKYVAIIMRADNDGEGGVLALAALTQRTFRQHPRWVALIGVLGLCGVALFFGDGIITPAMSVLSAIEGLEVAAPGMHEYVVPLTVLILTCLFFAQRFGTSYVGKAFGPITLLWFAAIGLIGAYNIAQYPAILKAINPWWGVAFFLHHNWHAVFILGAVVLAVTGGEALYADMGHFGAPSIRLSWNYIVLPMLALNYLGQGALILVKPDTAGNPFYEAIPHWGIFPMVILATLATVIASQAVITGAYSVASQAMQLGSLPRMTIRHTSSSEIGQIYVPAVNWILFVSVILTVIGFGSSDAMATAYGVSVTGTMLITTLLMIFYVAYRRKVALPILICVAALFLTIDFLFFYANIIKFFSGAWFPLLVGLVVFTLMMTWHRGRRSLREKVRKNGITLASFLPGLMLAPPVRVPGTAVFLTADCTMVPQALMHNLKHNKVLHQRNIFLTVDNVSMPYVAAEERIKLENLGDNFYSMTLQFGFMDTPDIPSNLQNASGIGTAPFDLMDTTFFVGRETVVLSNSKTITGLPDRLFALMYRNSAPANAFFHIPGNRIVELGSQIQI